ncbi:MAG: PAS domain-containing sensor histidine kinase [Trichormus sp. ATA11-4-KO1]|nr:PAS domain-containing sensor histidine kinase [Trichormus sp. ATA11-4-KO1]
MANLWRTVQKWWMEVIPPPTTGAFSVEYQAWRTHFLWQRLRLWLWIGLICVFTFILRDVYNFFFPLKEFEKLPSILRNQGLMINLAILLSLLICLALHKSQFGRRHPEIVFLGLSWSITLSGQIFSTIKGFAVPDIVTWTLVFLSQVTFMPVYWQMHLMSQLGLLIYYFGVNTTLGLKVPLSNQTDIYSVTLVLYLFWFCLICNIGVYLYDRLQHSEFNARKELESANQKLKVAEAKYRSIFENAVEGIFQSSPNGSYITANPALATIYGYSSPEEVIDKFTDIEHQLYVNPHRRAEFVRLMEQQGIISEFESQIYRRDGSIVWIAEKAYAVRDEQGQLLYYEGLIEDITQRKQAESALKVFFHAVSHDLRNPVLGTLMVLKNLLEREGVESETLIPVSRSILERMVQSSDRQLNLINSLMETHINDVQGFILQNQAVELRTVVAAAIADLQPMLTNNQVALTNLVTADLPLVNADPTQLWRVFSNLIVNAIKHNPPGILLTIAAIFEGDQIYCTVSDNGLGISQEQRERLFDLYFRGGNNHNSVSLGLGLYLCKQIIKAHGGEIGVNSGLAAGTTFWFTLPVK